MQRLAANEAVPQRLNLSIPRDLYAKLKAACEENDITISAHVRALIEQEMKEGA